MEVAQMTSRERAVAALSLKEPDRVPIDIGGGTSTSLVLEAYEELKKHLGVSAETRLLSKVYRSARLDECVMRRLGSDFCPLRSKAPVNWTAPPSEPGTFIDVWGVKWKQAEYGGNGYYWEVACSPLANASVQDLEKYPWPDPTDPGYTAGLAEEAKALHEGTDYAVEASCGFYSFWELAYGLRGYEQLLMDLAMNKEFVSVLLAIILEINLEGTRRFLDRAGQYIDVFRTADDLASQSALLMSPGTYRQLLKPAYKKYFEFVKSKTQAKIVYHSDGNIVGLLDDLAEMGVDAINPVQPSAVGDTAILKSRFGHKLAFVGGIDTQAVLPRGSSADVAAEVHRRIRDLGPGGGYVLAAVHSIQVDVPPENILAMTDAAQKFGRYPLCLAGATAARP
jgi:uroporphyrinogen decarboxylase